MPDESEQRQKIEPLLGENMHARLKRISQMPHEESESKFVTIRGGIGPISVVGADFPPEMETTDVLSEEENEKNFRIYWERKRRFAKGIRPDSKAPEK